MNIVIVPHHFPVEKGSDGAKRGQGQVEASWSFTNHNKKGVV